MPADPLPAASGLLAAASGNALLGLASVLLLGIGAQWLAWRLRLPSILLLLLVGFAAGPFSGQRLLDPDALLGDALLPFVSIAVAIILLEGGLTLRLRDLRGSGDAVRNLVLFGCPLTMGMATLAARWLLDLSWGLSLLAGAILVVTGPTVIVPLLRHVRPSGAVGSVIRWEGIVTDPIGAILAVLVFHALTAVEAGEAATAVVLGGLVALSIGALAGGLGAALLVVLLRRHLAPDFLHTSISLAIGIGVFVLGEQAQDESGLLAVTLMGILLANQRFAVVEHIIEFKENLRVLLIASLFILLAARLPLEEFRSFDPRTILFVVALILVVRPVSVFASLAGTSLSWKERAFVAWMAPRGIVAAAVASVFALELAEAGVPEADRLVSVIFGVIVATVAVYGLTAGRLARFLGLSQGIPQGVLFVGAHDWAREMALGLKKAGVRVLMADTNRRDVQAARMAGLEAHHGSILSEEFEELVSLDGLGHLVCVTHNDEVNSLACMHFQPWFGRACIYQLPSSEEGEGETHKHLRGRTLFSPELDFWDWQARFRRGAGVKTTRLGEEFGLKDFLEHHGGEDGEPKPLFVVDGSGKLSVMTGQGELAAAEGDTVVAVVPAEVGASEEPRSEAAAAFSEGASS